MVFKDLLARLLRRGKAATAYPPAAELTEGLAFDILRDVAYKAVRGALLKPRLGAAKGIPLVGRHVRITNPARIHVGRGFVVEDLAELQGLSRHGLVFGNNVTIGRGAQVRPSGYYGRDVGVGLTIGDDSNIGPQSYLGPSGGIEIGSRVLMGPGVVILSENHVFDDATVDIKSQGIRRASTVIEDDVWLGARAVILGGVRVGRGAVVAAGAVVHRDVAPNSIVGGVPARTLKVRTRP